MKKNNIITLSILLILAICLAGCDLGLFDLDDEDSSESSDSSSGTDAGAAEGYRISRSTQTIDGRIYIYNYDYVSGAKINQITATVDGGSYSTAVYSFDSLDRTTDITTTYTDGSYTTSKVSFSDYTVQGQYQRLENYTNGSLSSYITYSYVYDSIGNITESEQRIYDAGGVLSSVTSSTYENGRVKRAEMSSSNSTYPYTSVSTYTYDSHGSVTMISTTGTTTVSGTSYSSTSTTTFTNEYSAAGNLIKVTQSGGSVIEYEYERY